MNDLKELKAINATCGEIVGTQGLIFDQKIKLGTAEAALVYGLEQTPVADPNERRGWLFVKALADAAKFNYFYYGQGNLPITLGDITSLWAQVSIDVWANTASTPFFVIHTKPTGVGDAGAFYHSAVVCTLAANSHIIVGQSVRAWAYSVPRPHTHLREVSFNNRVTTGDGLPDEEILYISFHCDSSAPQAAQILVESLGYTFFGTESHRIDRSIALIH
tara:strand:+ start:5254 stop:5910 length:657 start_codon:yes stop_codon:yes gene_type:complete